MCWNHFYKLVASFRTVQQPKTFVMLNGFWPLRGCEGGGLSEYIKICGENITVDISKILKHLKNLKYIMKTEGIIVLTGVPSPLKALPLT